LKAVRETVDKTLRQGIYGWQVIDITVAVTHSGYYPRQSHAHGHFDKSMSSTAGDFRNLTPLVLMDALSQAGTLVYEPIHRFDLEIPADTLGHVLPMLARMRAVPLEQITHGSLCLVTGSIPAAAVCQMRPRLLSLTRGEGVLESAFERYEQVRGKIPVRARSDHNPLNRKEYLLRVTRGVAEQ
jgi:ribosomal protection tetracycline resistance protein